MNTLKERLTALAQELTVDHNRPEGRWGMHGHTAVDDDYFMALEYCVCKINKILNGVKHEQ